MFALRLDRPESTVLRARSSRPGNAWHKHDMRRRQPRMGRSFVAQGEASPRAEPWEKRCDKSLRRRHRPLSARSQSEAANGRCSLADVLWISPPSAVARATDCFRAAGPGRSRFGKPWDCGFFRKAPYGAVVITVAPTGAQRYNASAPGLARRLAAPWATNDRPIRGLKQRTSNPQRLRLRCSATNPRN